MRLHRLVVALDAAVSRAYGSVYVLEVGLEALLNVAGVGHGVALVLAPERAKGILTECAGIDPGSAADWLLLLRTELENMGAWSETPALISWASENGYNSYYWLPFAVSGWVMGGAVLLSHEEVLWTEAQKQWLTQAADKIATALERTRLIEELQSRVLEWGLLMRLGEEISARPDETLLSKFVSLVAGTFGYEQVAFLRPDHAYWNVAALAGRPLAGWVEGERILCADGLLPQVIENQTTEVVWSSQVEGSAGPVCAEIAVPIRLGSEVFGILDVRSREPGVYTQRDPSVLKAISGQLAVALENQRLLLQARTRATLLEEVANIGHEIVATLRMKDLMRQVVNLVGQRLGYEAVHILLLDEYQQIISLVAEYQLGVTRYYDPPEFLLPVEQGLVGRATRTGKAVRVGDVRTDPDFVPNPNFSVLSEISMPLKISDRVIGVLDIESKRSNAFTEEDEHVLATLANLIAVAIENARLYERQRESAAELAERNLMLVQAQARLVSAERLAAIGQISLAIEHEINNPMTAILGNAEWLLEEDGLSEEVRVSLQLIYDMAARVRDIVQRLENVEDRRCPYIGSLDMIDLSASDTSEQSNEGQTRAPGTSPRDLASSTRSPLSIGWNDRSDS
jgi:GAF domain-containing protein